MEFSVLGPLEVRSDGTEVGVGAPKLRALLISLLLDVGRVVPAERLVQDLWGEDATDQALVSLRSYVSNLRRLLPGTGDRPLIATRGRGYVLDVDPGTVDAVRFEQLARQGRDLLATAPADAVRRLDAALALWRGPALDDVADLAFARAPAARLEELRLAAVEVRLDALLAAGRASEVVAEAESHAAAHPLRERPRAQQMLALVRTGRAPEALAVHRQYRELLAEELGLDPSERLDALADAILRRDPGLVPDPIPAPPPTSATAPAHTPPAAEEAVSVSPAPADQLVGRTAERERLREAVGRLVAGDGGVVLLAGEPGIGKTALLRALTTDATSRGVPVVWGRCHEAEGAPAFWPWVQVIRTLADRLDPAALDRALGGAAAAVLHLVPELGDESMRPPLDPAADPQAARFVLHDAVATFLRRVALDTGLVVVLDDLHWGDLASLELAGFVGSQARGSRVMLAGSYRSADAERTPELDATLATLAREETVLTLPLGGLSPEDVARLAMVVAGGEVDPAVVGEMHRRAGGNPFFVRQLAQLHAESGNPTQPGGVPMGVRHVLLRRLQLLPEEVRRTLEAASVFGQDVDARPLARCLDLSLPAVLDHLDVAAEHGLVEAGTGATAFRFVHALIRETLHGELAPSRLARLHAAAADALEQEDLPPVQSIAEHLWLAADLVDRDRPVRWLRDAAEEALLVFAHEQAEQYLRRALHLLEHRPADTSDMELQLRLRLVQVLVGLHGWSASSIPDVAERARELAMQTQVVPELTSLWWSRWAYSMTRGELEEAHERAAQLLTDVVEVGTPAEVVAGHVAVVYTELFRGTDHAVLEEHLAAAAAAEAEAPPETLGLTPERLAVARRISVALTHAIHGDADDAVAAIADAVRMGRTMGTPFSESYGRMFGGFVGGLLDRPDVAHEWSDHGLELARRMSLEHLANLTIPAHAWACVRLGQDPGPHLARMARAIDDLVSSGHLHAVPMWQLLQAETLAHVGDLDGARAALAASRATAADIHELVYTAQWDRVEARLAGVPTRG